MSRPLPLLAVLAFAFAGVSGCLDQPVPNANPDPGVILEDTGAIYDRVMALMQGIPCQAEFSASKNTDNFKRLAHTAFMMPAKTDNLTEPVGSRELDLRGDLM